MTTNSPVIRRLICAVGIHAWKYTPAEYAWPCTPLVELPSKPASRECRHCRKVQVEDRYCLGMHPPEYHSEWHTQTGRDQEKQ